jgi:hypothetical protein
MRGRRSRTPAERHMNIRLRFNRPIDCTAVLYSSHSVYDAVTRKAKFFDSFLRMRLEIRCSLSTYGRLVRYQMELPQ